MTPTPEQSLKNMLKEIEGQIENIHSQGETYPGELTKFETRLEELQIEIKANER